MCERRSFEGLCLCRQGVARALSICTLPRTRVRTSVNRRALSFGSASIGPVTPGGVRRCALISEVMKGEANVLFGGEAALLADR